MKNISVTTSVRAGRKLSRVLRGICFRTLIRLGGGTCGSRLEVEPGSTIRWGAHPGIRIGCGVRFGRGVIIDVPAGAVLEIADGVKVMHYSVIAASEYIQIGSQTQIGEMASVRDADHGSGGSELSLRDDLITTPTLIGSGVWIARGVAVLRGAIIGDGAVVGANSVVVAGYPVAAGTRVAGAPAKPLGKASTG